MSSTKYHLTDLAYTKLILHALKYSHQNVNGVLLGSPPSAPGHPVLIVDAVPLQHHWTSLSPMMEVGLGMATNHAHRHQLHVVGYYQAPERVGDTTLSPVGEHVAARIKQTFPTPIALVVSRRMFVTIASVLCPPMDTDSKRNFENRFFQSYLSSSPSDFRQVEGRLTFDRTIPTRAQRLIRHNNILDRFWDFDDYLEDIRAPFLTNGAVQAALNSPQQPH
ncbi:UPF0172-domain-containing protein [Russula earlei]|uniref:UPF0172-domain-containing protein n=1 Tax=Russula earlei TaxID=71964 RepID=A0ACC0TSM0_9AGAM|nr:UPF0172-domain-containing protein [Russula earlei]